MAKDKYYFDHDYHARNDDKILELRASFGAEGYGVFWMIVETMAENENGGIPLSLMGGLSLGYGCAKDTLSNIISSCTSVGLFFEKDGYLFSKRVLKHKDFRKEQARNGKIGADIKWKNHIKPKNKIDEFDDIVAFFNNVCVKCEGESGLQNVERDHIIPTFMGGSDEIFNWQPLCAKCNSSKGRETIDWRIIYAKKHGLAIPERWLPNSPPMAIKEKEKKKEEDTISLGAEKFDFEINLKIPANVLEAAERNQLTMTKEPNTDFIKHQWKTFLIERVANHQYRNLPDLTQHFLNWNRNKFPPKINGNGIHKQSSTRSDKSAGAKQVIDLLNNELNEG